MGVKMRSVGVFVVTTLVASYLFAAYASSLVDGFDWKRKADWRLVAPEFVEENLEQAKKVPNFTLSDRFGNLVDFEQFSSVDVILINVWNSSCPVCEEEIPALSEMDRKLADLGNIALITITTDEKWEQVQRFFPLGTDLRVLFDPEQQVTGEVFGTEKFPETFVLDKERRVRARFDGQRAWHSPEMFSYLQSFL